MPGWNLAWSYSFPITVDLMNLVLCSTSDQRDFRNGPVPESFKSSRYSVCIQLILCKFLFYDILARALLRLTERSMTHTKSLAIHAHVFFSRLLLLTMKREHIQVYRPRDSVCILLPMNVRDSSRSLTRHFFSNESSVSFWFQTNGFYSRYVRVYTWHVHWHIF